MKLNITHTEATALVVEIWQDGSEDINLVGTQECDLDDDDIDIELQPGQYIIVRGVE